MLLTKGSLLIIKHESETRTAIMDPDPKNSSSLVLISKSHLSRGAPTSYLRSANSKSSNLGALIAALRFGFLTLGKTVSVTW